MFTHKVERKEKNTAELQIVIPKEDIAKGYAVAFKTLRDNFEMEGFRKGKVPAAVAEKRIDRETVYQEMIKTLIPAIYQEIVKKEGLKPVISPKIELVEAKENSDWKVKITLAEKPSVILGNCKELVKKIKDEQKKEGIWVPGKDQKPADDEKEKSRKQQELLNKILEVLLREVKCEIADMIVEEELNHRLSTLLTDIQKIGLSVEAYLKSKNLTQDQLKKRYKDEIDQTYKLEFTLAEIADKEKIEVKDSDLDALFSRISDPKEKEAAKANAYFYASVLRKQKTIDYLLAI